MSKEPKYQILARYKKIELRIYEPFLVAEVEGFGNRKEGIRSGFKILAHYLFGGNSASENLPMSIPVTQQKNGNGWKIRFMLSHATDLTQLPKPNDSVVKLISVPQKKFCVIRFSGTPDDKKIEKATHQLREFVDLHHLKIYGEPIFAFYNAPWTIPFLRRNEVMFELLN